MMFKSYNITDISITQCVILKISHVKISFKKLYLLIWTVAYHVAYHYSAVGKDATLQMEHHANSVKIDWDTQVLWEIEAITITVNPQNKSYF